jgi:hypothetical protein
MWEFGNLFTFSENTGRFLQLQMEWWEFGNLFTILDVSYSYKWSGGNLGIYLLSLQILDVSYSYKWSDMETAG